jgi:ABC-2 type transport system ATP-binding protein
MKSEVAISVRGVHKSFKLPHEKKNSIKMLFTSLGKKGGKRYETQHALRNVSFDVKKGEFFGIVGRNGSGKSTLLKLLAEIYQPTKGSVSVQGRLVPFIELGVGFNPELTGKENVYLSGALSGFSAKEMDEMYDDIVAFAELEQFMDQKLKNYSSGMQVRLAFAVATRARADILLIDEVLAVGDAEFQRKCFQYFKNLKKNKKTVVFVSHDMSAVREYCDRAILIDQSRIIKEGNVSQVASAYTKMFMSEEGTTEQKIDKKRWGDKQVSYTKVSLSKKTYTSEDTYIEIDLHYKTTSQIDNPIFGIAIKNGGGTVIVGTNTLLQRKNTGIIETNTEGVITWKVLNIFNDGNYILDVAITQNDATTQHDWWEDAKAFTVYREEHSPFVVEVPVEITLR